MLTKMFVCSFVLLPALLQQQKCDLRNMTSPEAINGRVEQAVQPYFPHAKGVTIPAQHAIVAITCAQGVSYQFVEKIAQSMANDPSMTQQLGMVRYLPFVGGASYASFVLAFDSGTIWYDINTRQIAIRPMNDAFFHAYNQTCGFESQ